MARKSTQKGTKWPTQTTDLPQPLPLAPPLSTPLAALDLPFPLPMMFPPGPPGPAPEKEKKRPKETVKSIPGVPQNVFDDWETVRKKKRAPITSSAVKLMASEAAKAGISIAEAVEYAAGMGWQGFRADWYQPRAKRPAAIEMSHTETAYDRAARDRFAQFSPFVRKEPTAVNKSIDEHLTIDENWSFNNE